MKPQKQTLKSVLNGNFQLPPKLIAIRGDHIVGRFPTMDDVRELAEGKTFLSCRYVDRVEEACGIAIAFMAE